jgi:hypothetical protein
MIKKAGYGNMDWLDALKAFKAPKDPASDLSKQNEADLVDNALESTANVAFNISAKPETKYEALNRSSKEIAQKAADENKVAAVNSIKQKIASNGINPVELGIQIREGNGKRPITKEEWESSTDARWVEKIATEAALEYEKREKQGWQQNGLKPAQTLSSKFDPTTMRDGRIMSSTGANEETRGRPTQIPANAASIFDPFKLDRFAQAETEHDRGVREKREAAKSREQEKKAQYAKDPNEPEPPEPMRTGQIQKSGGEDQAVFQQRVPKNKVSMLDTYGEEKLSSEQIKEKLSQMFTSRIEDNGEKIKEANKKRKEEIQGKKEKDRSWDKLEKPLSTAELTQRIIKQFTCPPPPDGQ